MLEGRVGGGVEWIAPQEDKRFIAVSTDSHDQVVRQIAVHVPGSYRFPEVVAAGERAGGWGGILNSEVGDGVERVAPQEDEDFSVIFAGYVGPHGADDDIVLAVAVQVSHCYGLPKTSAVLRDGIAQGEVGGRGEGLAAQEDEGLPGNEQVLAHSHKGSGSAYDDVLLAVTIHVTCRRRPAKERQKLRNRLLQGVVGHVDVG